MNDNSAGPSCHFFNRRRNVERVSASASTEPRKRLADVAIRAATPISGPGPAGCERNGSTSRIAIRLGPKKVAFVAARRGNYSGEGVQTLHLDTASFRGDVLVTSNETCGRLRKPSAAG